MLLKRRAFGKQYDAWSGGDGSVSVVIELCIRLANRRSLRSAKCRYLPVTGGQMTYAGRFFDPALGFALTWSTVGL